jgi:hypothetical protein
MTPLEQLKASLDWYTAAQNSLRRIHRLGDRYWDELPWAGVPALGRDNLLRQVERDTAKDEAQTALSRLDELAVALLFSVFEGAVRTAVLEQLKQASVGLPHPMLTGAARDAMDAVNRRSFAVVLDYYSRSGHADIADVAEKARQVRRYRNWISHGKRGKEVTAVSPREVYARLKAFLELVAAHAPPIRPEPTSPV